MSVWSWLSARRLEHPPADAGPASRFSLGFGLALVLAGVVVASLMRLAQWEQRLQQRDLYFADGEVMMTTLDAYYGLQIARKQQAGQFVAGVPDPLRVYQRPSDLPGGGWLTALEPKRLPLLSRLISAASTASGRPISQTAALLPPLLASLFMVPLFLALWQLGAPAAGLMGGLVGTFAIDYFGRTGVGWSDTDPLNLFFPWTIAAICLVMGRDLRLSRLLAWSVVAGLVNAAFLLWYSKVALSLGIALMLALHLALAGAGWRKWLPCLVVFLLCSGPAQFENILQHAFSFSNRYLWPDHKAAAQVLPALRFPAVWSTLSELQHLPLGQTLANILPGAGLSGLGLLASLVWALPRWRRLAPLLPLMALGAMALLGSRRFAMYLAPFAGIGWGMLVSWLWHRLVGARPHSTAITGKPSETGWQRLRALTASAKALHAVPLLACCGLMALWLAQTAPQRLALPPALPAPVFSEIKSLDALLPADARIWSWWDLGYAIRDTARRGVYHDGSLQFTPQTNLVAISLVSPDPSLLHDLMRAVDHLGNPGVEAEATHVNDLAGLMGRLRQAAPARSAVPQFLLFTPDMPAKFAVMQTLATPLAAGARPARPFGMAPLTCHRVVEQTVSCDGLIADLRAGRVRRTDLPAGAPDNSRPLRRLVVVADGSVQAEQSGPAPEGLTIELLTVSGRLQAAYLMDELAYASNLNQMYLLGRFDTSRFEQLVHHPPHARVFRLRSAGG